FRRIGVFDRVGPGGERHAEGLVFIGALAGGTQDLDRDRVARLLGADHAGQIFGIGDRLTVDRHDDVPADRDLAAGGLHFKVAAAYARLSRRRSGFDRLHERAGFDG